MRGGWPEHFLLHKSKTVMNSRGKRLSPRKAQEMLTNPPAGQPMTKAQVGFFQAVAHGMKPRKRS